MKKAIIMSVAGLTAALLLSGASSAYTVNPNEVDPKNIQGSTNMYADLDKDGTKEHVVVERVMREMYRDGSTSDYYIVVYDNQGREKWRSDECRGIFYCNKIEHCLVHDIDADGHIELVFSGWGCSENLDSAPNTRIFRWKNGAFAELAPGTVIYIQNAKDPKFARIDNKCHDFEMGSDNKQVHNLRKVNGNLWGDVAWLTAPKNAMLPRYFKRSEGKQNYYVFHPDHQHVCKTARFLPSKGGMRIVEYKNVEYGVNEDSWR